MAGRTTVAEILKKQLQQVELDEKQWLDLVQARADAIKRIEDDITFPTLGSVKCLKGTGIDDSSPHVHSLYSDLHRYDIASIDAILKLQGFYHHVPSRSLRDEKDVIVDNNRGDCYTGHKPHPPYYGGTHYLIGYERKRGWVQVSVIFSPQIVAGEEYQQARTIHKHSANVEALIKDFGLLPLDIMRALTSDLASVLRTRESQLTALRILKSQMRGEDCTLIAINR